MRDLVFSPTAILIVAWGNVPGIVRATLFQVRYSRGDAPGDVVHGLWPMGPVEMF